MRGRPLKTSAVWKLVRELIEAEREQWICVALLELRLQGRITESREDALVAYIEKLLQGHHTYNEWVLEFHPGVWKATKGDHDGCARRGRLAWLDHLIAEAKAKGD